MAPNEVGSPLTLPRNTAATTAFTGQSYLSAFTVARHSPSWLTPRTSRNHRSLTARYNVLRMSNINCYSMDIYVRH